MSRSMSLEQLPHIVVPWAALLVVGLIMVGSASVALGGGYLERHLLFLALALALFTVSLHALVTRVAQWLTWRTEGMSRQAAHFD